MNRRLPGRLDGDAAQAPAVLGPPTFPEPPRTLLGASSDPSHRLGCSVIAVDRSPLDAQLAHDPRVTFVGGDAFAYEPPWAGEEGRGVRTWMVSDVIAYPSLDAEPAPGGPACTREDAPCSTGFSALAALVCPPSRPCWCTRYPARAVELVRRWGSRRWASRMVVCQAPARPNPLSSLSRSHRLPHPPQVTMKFQAGVDWAALDEAGSVAESLAWGTTFGASTSSTTRTRSRSCCSYESELR